MHRLFILLSLFLLIGCQPTAPTESIHEAAKSGNLDLVQRHIKAGTPINKKDNTGWTPLHWAAMRGHASVVEALVVGGADVRITGLMNKTALNLAVENQRPEVVRILQAAGSRGRGRPLVDGGVGVSDVLDNN